jgi:branched-chain amino acid transport system permease protein
LAPFRSKFWFGVILICFVVVGGAGFLTEFNLRLAILAIITSIAVIGLYFSFGLIGLIHLAQASFVGIGAYSSALIAQWVGLTPWLTVFAATAVTAVAAALLAYPMHRTGSHYLALTTAGFAVSFEVIMRNWTSVTGGYDGLGAIPLLRLNLTTRGDLEFLYICIGFLLVSTLIAALVRRSHIGRGMIAVRDDELAAAVSGIDVARMKTKAFVLCSAYGGLSGALYAHYGGFISPDDFSLARSIMLLSMLIVGGEFSILGAVAGSCFLTYLPEWLRAVGAGYMAVFGVLMLAVLILMPNGIMGALRGWVQLRPEKAHD